MGMGIPYATIRPTLVFGEGDLLLNNMAWALRRFPVFPAFGRGDYPVLPVYAAGPETFTFEELLRLLASAVGARVRLVHTPPSMGFALTRLVDLLLRDVVLTRDEVDGLVEGLLTSNRAPTGNTDLGDWLQGKGEVLGRKYVSELRRNFRRSVSSV